VHIPARIIEHPLESLLAGALLLVVLLGSAERGRDGATTPPSPPTKVQHQKLCKFPAGPERFNLPAII
jgi:hypothetical protein